MGFWEEIRRKGPPVVMYGTGDAADKLYTLLGERGVKVEGCFVNDEFVRSRTFQGYKVLSYERARAIFGEMRVVMGFGSHNPSVLDTVCRIASETDFFCPDLLQDKDGRLFDEAYVEDHLKDLEWARSLLGDEKSREVFDSLVEYRLSGRIEPLRRTETDEMENWRLLSIGGDEAFLDLGAYNGDTIERFLSFTPTYEKIIGVEPEKRNYRILSEKFQGKEGVTLVNAAVGRKEGETLFSSAGRGSKVGEGRRVSTVTIDSVTGGNRVSFIKYDIEGEEENAILGGLRTISLYRPKMVLSAYHRIDDLWVLPHAVEKARTDYHWLLRHSPALPAWEVEYYVL